jgi:DNA-binding response OmpR family regulator
MNILTSVPRALPLTSWEHYILVIEDDPELRDSYRSALRGAGLAAVGVADGATASRMIETQRPSAIVLDLVRARLDGPEIQRALRSNPHAQDIPLVVVTGTDIRDLNIQDCACVLRKPIDVQTLVAAVRHTVSQFGTRRCS